MILSGGWPAELELPPGGSMFRAHASREGGLRSEVLGIWRFLHAARERPLAIDLLGDAGRAREWIGDFPELTPVAHDCRESAIVIYTSGTTGEPKPCRHGLARALERTRAGESGARWLLAYAPFRWAGLSVLLHVVRSSAELVVPEDVEPDAIVCAGARFGATHVSMTPSHLRRMLLSVSEEELRRLPLRQVTFGGEAATQPVLDKARSLWPNARVSHVYATSEFGDICATSDAIEGFPRAKFERPDFEFSDDGELLLAARPTGDIWELRDDRYHFSGRREEIINVGGVKVSPLQVETAALAVAGVVEARAYARRNALLGEVVALEYSGTIDERTLRRAVCKLLAKPAWPASVQRVEAIALTSAGKTRRLGDA